MLAFQYRVRVLADGKLFSLWWSRNCVLQFKFTPQQPQEINPL